jgi:hypothetical protein
LLFLSYLIHGFKNIPAALITVFFETVLAGSPLDLIFSALFAG